MNHKIVSKAGILKMIAVILIFAFLSTSCVKQTIVAKPNTKVYLTERTDGCKYVDYKKTHYLLWGIIQVGEGPEVLYGNNNTVRVETEVTFVDGLVSFISLLGFYSIRTANVYKCNKK
jgi:hypothetical protein